MSNRTELFKKYLQVISETRGLNEGEAELLRNKAKQETKQVHENFSVKDSFVKESKQLMKHIMGFQMVVKQLTSKYESATDMTDEEKDDFDTESKLQLQQYFEKYKQLQTYERQRQEMMKEKLETWSASLPFFSRSTDDVANFHKTNNQFRMGLLQSLNMWLMKISDNLSTIQQTRMSRQRHIDAIDFNAQLHVPEELSVSQSHMITTTHEEIKQYEETMSQLSMEQLQILATEHEELLNLKNEELEKAETLRKTAVDIASLQSELATHLQVQTQNINTLLDNQTDVEMEMEKGNKQLRQANRKGDALANMVMWFAILCGLLLLFFDYIN
ncbi:unnamed protein product [Kluyveromyces dobzhanskii CBS 2104]|uniref:WGS project CCBQ000000000 data, contig 00107 n=1 Tax=Kluyveromyces dobzhanskii CBS 2104 TaxID=1427455 RepID=A0A0A8L172_9SACH|nr:unnamed protein product [Kluyveromyces dobzhanskii CBS 2104]